jgi:hypothetical protein
MRRETELSNINLSYVCTVIWVGSADIECCSMGSQHCMDISVHLGFLVGIRRECYYCGYNVINTFSNEACDWWYRSPGDLGVVRGSSRPRGSETHHIYHDTRHHSTYILNILTPQKILWLWAREREGEGASASVCSLLRMCVTVFLLGTICVLA